MALFDRYIFKNLLIATIFVTITLTGVIFLTQSLRFLELVIDSGASAYSFWILTLLALPRFFEIILPVALMVSIVFVYHKLSLDSELIIMRATGHTPLMMGKPALILAIIVTIILWLMTMWVGPSTLSNMQQLRQVIKAQFSSLLIKEGVFNPVADDLTVFVREKGTDHTLYGIMIHDGRPINESPVTITAKRGQIVSSAQGQQVVVYEGLRQNLNGSTGAMEKLDFERYTIDLPDNVTSVRQRWAEPDERTIIELLNPDPENPRDIESQREFQVEIHRRVISPVMAISFALIALCCLLLGQISRRGQNIRIAAVTLSAVILQGLYLAAFNIATGSNAGLFFMYFVVIAPLCGGLFLMSRFGDSLRQKLFFSRSYKAQNKKIEAVT